MLSSGIRWSICLIALVLPSGPLWAQGYSPEEAPRRMTPAPGLAVSPVASEPWCASRWRSISTIAGGSGSFSKLAEMRRLNNDLRASPGNAQRGHELFRKQCATCHRLHDEGERTGPELTHANRKDRDYLLASIVDPSAVVRKEFLSYQVQTEDGRVLTGLIVEQSPGQITLLDAKRQRTTLARGQVESVQESPLSLMPEDLLKHLKPQELRDLFSYLQR
jgi:putative heme-binding domain-containing protein